MTQLTYLVSENQYQAELNGEIVGHIDYTREGHRVTLLRTHTRDDAHAPTVARMLTRYALNHVRERGYHAVAKCDITRRFLREHPEYTDVI